MRLWQILFQVVSTESRLLNTMGRKRNQQRKFNSFAQKKRARKERVTYFMNSKHHVFVT